MSNTEFNATNGEQNSVQTLTSDNVAQENAVQSEPQKPLKLGEFLQSSDGKGLSQNDKGQFVPDNKQIKILVNCIDDSTGEIISLAKIDTSKVTSMKELFRKSERKDFSGIEEWDTSGVSTFASMFESVECFNRDISGWNVENAKSFYFMFWNASSFNQPIGAKWNTKSAEGMIGMFCQARSFNNGGQPFGEKWVMDKVKWTWRMFWGAENFNQEINHWNVANVENMQRMFMNAKAFNKPLSKWNVSNVKNMEEMFNGAESFNQDLSAWGDKLSNAQTTKRMFAATKALNQTFAWKINNKCVRENMVKGSPLKLDITLINDEGEQQEKEILQDMSENTSTNAIKPTQQLASSKEKFKLYQIVKKDKTIGNDDYTKAINSFLNEKNWRKCDREELYGWIPKNIRENYAIYLAKKQDNKIYGADGSEWDFICYEVFGYLFLVEVENKDNDKENVFDISQKELTKHKRRTLTIKQEAVDEDDETLEFERVIDYKYNSLYVSLEDDKKMYIYNGNSNQDTQNSDRIFNIIGALVLAKAYESKMYDFNKMARQARGADLMKCHKEICEFDLKFYQNVPVQVHNLALLNFWDKLDKHYKITNTHEELQDTITRIAQLVSDEIRERENEIREKENKEEDERRERADKARQDENDKRAKLSIKLNWIMVVVAILTAFGVALDIYRFCKGN